EERLAPRAKSLARSAGHRGELEDVARSALRHDLQQLAHQTQEFLDERTLENAGRILQLEEQGLVTVCAQRQRKLGLLQEHEAPFRPNVTAALHRTLDRAIVEQEERVDQRGSSRQVRPFSNLRERRRFVFADRRLLLAQTL